jgi:hypothetical protein
MLDQPRLSIMPFLTFYWNCMKASLLILFDIFVIVPANLVVLLNRIFHGRWKYRKFRSAPYLAYPWLWLWRGEAPIVPFIFVGPLLKAFTVGHFKRRLHRLRDEIELSNDLSEDVRSASLQRLDAALERWRTPRLPTLIFTGLLPGLIAVLDWSRRINELSTWLGLTMPTNVGSAIYSWAAKNFSIEAPRKLFRFRVLAHSMFRSHQPTSARKMLRVEGSSRNQHDERVSIWSQLRLIVNLSAASGALRPFALAYGASAVGGGTKPLSRQWRLWLPSALIQTSGFSDRAFRLDD